ncbi:hypothetical protein BT93_A0331 [Corymbia citriodora subsp. variegata]|nr:hypothetical protein BT93_A0331 [Corymbia citriodora subsp. variegata]
MPKPLLGVNSTLDLCPSNSLSPKRNGESSVSRSRGSPVAEDAMTEGNYQIARSLFQSSGKRTFRSYSVSFY